jgi:hypothetical protein
MTAQATRTTTARLACWSRCKGPTMWHVRGTKARSDDRTTPNAGRPRVLLTRLGAVGRRGGDDGIRTHDPLLANRRARCSRGTWAGALRSLLGPMWPAPVGACGPCVARARLLAKHSGASVPVRASRWRCRSKGVQGPQRFAQVRREPVQLGSLFGSHRYGGYGHPGPVLAEPSIQRDHGHTG